MSTGTPADHTLEGRLILVTGAARRIGRALAMACARAGADLVIHYCHSEADALVTQRDIEALGRRAWTVRADLAEPTGASQLMRGAANRGPLFALVNNAAIFGADSLVRTRLDDWERHLAVNLTSPMLLIQQFASQVPAGAEGRVVNILDWRATQPGADHFPYTVSKAALAALTKAAAQALAPAITVNGLALGAILPPEGSKVSARILDAVPAARWGELSEVEKALIFLLGGPAYITGEILHLDGGRHLT